MPRLGPYHTRGAQAPPGSFSPPGPRPAAALFLVFTLLAVAPLRAVGGEEAIEEIEVTGTRTQSIERRAVTGFASRIEIDDRPQHLDTMTDVLAESVGVQVRRFGGLGAFSTISIRGSSANQVQLYLDGIPLSRARNETVNLADLPLDDIDHVEVYRGTTPVLLGAGALGGAVNLVTRAPSATPRTELLSSYGSFNTRKLTATHSRRWKDFGLLAFLTYTGSRGNFSFRDDNGTPLQPNDDRNATRLDNAFDAVEGLVKLEHDVIPNLHADLTSEMFFKDQDLAGAGNRNAFPGHAGLRELRSLNYLRLTHDGILDGTVQFGATLFGTYERLALRDPNGKLGGGNQNRRDTTTLLGTTVNGRWVMADWNLVESLVQTSHERFAPFTRLPAPTNEPDQTRWRVTAAVQDQASFFDDRLLFAPTVRYEHLLDTFTEIDRQLRPTGPRRTTERDLWTGSLGLALHVFPWLTLKGNLSRQSRPPNFSELFGTSGYSKGESDLRPETAVNRDIGLVLDVRPDALPLGVHFEYAYFNNDIANLIVFTEFAQGRFLPQNIGAVRIRGHEVSVAADVLGQVRLDLNYTHQDAEDRGTQPASRGKRLPLRPTDEFYARLAVNAGPARLTYEFDLVGDNARDRVNFDRVARRDTHTLSLDLDVGDRLSLGVEARNFTDNQIRDAGNFPLPGRSFLGTVKLHL